MTPSNRRRTAGKTIEERSGRRTLYDTLQVSPSVEAQVLQAAYRALALRNHPDRNSDEAATARMRELNEAYTLLGDPHRRALYDMSLRRRRTGNGSTTALGQVHREKMCWRCGNPLQAFGAYCRTCEWLRCYSCGGCGCQHPGRRRAAYDHRPRIVTLLGWGVAALMGAITIVGAVLGR